METTRTPKERKAEIKGEITAKVNNELARTSNHWLACLLTRFTSIALQVQILGKQEQFRERTQSLSQKLKILTERVSIIAINTNYQEPSDATKDELLDELAQLYYEFEELNKPC